MVLLVLEARSQVLIVHLESVVCGVIDIKIEIELMCCSYLLFVVGDDKLLFFSINGA